MDLFCYSFTNQIINFYWQENFLMTLFICLQSHVMTFFVITDVIAAIIICSFTSLSEVCVTWLPKDLWSLVIWCYLHHACSIKSNGEWYKHWLDIYTYLIETRECLYWRVTKGSRVKVLQLCRLWACFKDHHYLSLRSIHSNHLP